ncbi:MAG: isochorismatase family protein [Chloroflexota bacterium]
MASWDGLIPPDDREVYRRAGYGKPRGLGQRPALLVVDMEYNFTGDRPEPILESIAKYPNSSGYAAWEAVPHIARLIGLARGRGVPVAFTHGIDRPGNGPDDVRPRKGNEIIDELAPCAGEIVIAKAAPSAFGNTSMVADLIRLGVDTVIVTGCTTSGCVRASVVDAYTYHFKVVVVEECVFDRARVPHLVNLFDMAMKYADVISLEAAIEYLGGLAVNS